MSRLPSSHRPDPDLSVAAAVGAALRSWRTEQRLTQRQLAEKAGVTTAAISKLERGRSRPRVLTALRITHALGRSLDDLLTAIAPANDPRRPDGSIADCGFCRESRSSFEAIAAAGPNPETVRWLGHDGAWEMAQSIANKYRGQSVCSTVHWVADLIEGRVAA